MPGDLAASRRVRRVQFSRTRLSFGVVRQRDNIYLLSRTMEELDSLHRAVREAATARGIPVLDATPDLTGLPTVLWDGNWQAYLDLAAKVQARLLYLQVSRYNHEELIEEIAGEEEDFAAPDDDLGVATPEDMVWLRDRLKEVLAPWSERCGEILNVTGVWVRDGIAHVWRHQAVWSADHGAAVARALVLSHWGVDGLAPSC